MIYIENECHDPYFNAAFEEYVFDKYRQGTILLLWINSPCVVCGRNQNIFSEIDVLEAKRRNIAVIRRESGGGCVYHDMGNINYTFITDAFDENNNKISYQDMIMPVVNALNNMGIKAHMNRTCDIAIDNMKISGSAQYSKNGRLLHHATLLYDTCLDNIRELTRGHRDNYEGKGVKSEPWQVTNIKEHFNSSMTAEEFKNKLKEMLNPVEVKTLLADELNEVKKIMNEKYLTWEWTYGRNPSFNYKDEDISFMSKKGIICDVEVACDELRSKLLFQKLDTDVIADIIKDFDDKKYLIEHIF